MIIIRSDYSPEVAPDKQEDEHITMMNMLLLLSGFTQEQLAQYMETSEKSSQAYTEEFVKQNYDGAVQATSGYQRAMEKILIDAGVLIQNRLKKPASEGFFHHIETTVYKGYDEQIPVARIERPVTDIEAETYQDNQTGYINGQVSSA